MFDVQWLTFQDNEENVENGENGEGGEDSDEDDDDDSEDDGFKITIDHDKIDEAKTTYQVTARSFTRFNLLTTIGNMYSVLQRQYFINLILPTVLGM